MNNRIMAIFDADKEFVSEFVNYLMREYKQDYEVFAFTTYDSLREFTQKRMVDILLVSCDVFERKINDLNIGQIILLKDKSTDMFKEYKSVFKYQKATSMMREVLECVEEDRRIKKRDSDICSEEASVIGVYSPVSRCMKTMFSLTMCDILGEKHSVLYMNFEEYSGLRKLMNKEFIADLSDLMYFYIQDPDKMLKKYSVIKQNYSKFSLIPPMMFSEDVRNVEASQWSSMIRFMSQNLEYNIIVLDLSNMVSNVFDMFDICDDIFMPVCGDFVSVSKLEEFIQVLREKKGEDVEDRIHRIDVGDYIYRESTNSSINSVINGKFREFVRTCLSEMEADDFG